MCTRHVLGLRGCCALTPCAPIMHAHPGQQVVIMHDDRCSKGSRRAVALDALWSRVRKCAAALMSCWGSVQTGRSLLQVSARMLRQCATDACRACVADVAHSCTVRAAARLGFSVACVDSGESCRDSSTPWAAHIQEQQGVSQRCGRELGTTQVQLLAGAQGSGCHMGHSGLQMHAVHACSASFMCAS